MAKYSRCILSAVAIGALCLGACRPGYMKAERLEKLDQGPAACARACEGLGMRMAALVLVSNQLPACVCQPTPKKGDAPNSSSPDDAAAASASGYVVVAAAVAARREQQTHQQQQARRY